MKKILLTSILFLVPFAITAQQDQQEVSPDSFPSADELGRELPATTVSLGIEGQAGLFSPQPIMPDMIPVDMISSVSTYQLSEIKVDIPYLYRIPVQLPPGMKHAQFGYDNRGLQQVSRNLFYYSGSSESVSYSVGFKRDATAGVVYMPTDWLIITGGAYATGYNFRGLQMNDVGISSSAKILLHDRVRVNLYGNYSVNGQRNAGRAQAVGGMPYGLYPQSSFGAGLELKVTEKIGIEWGVTHGFDPRSRSWETHRMTNPVFYP